MATLEDVARKAGCSPATASRALNATGAVSERTRRRVRKAASELGYRASVQPAPGRSYRRPVVGVLIPSLTNPVFSSSLSSIESRMLVAGHGVVIAQSSYDPAREADAIAALLNDRPTGLILTLCNALKSKVLEADLPPTVLLSNLPTGRYTAAVTVDNHAAGRELTEHLLSLGHRRILFVSGNFSASDRASLRYVGYRAAMEDAGFSPLEALQIPFVTGYDQLDLSVALNAFRPSAIIASNDLLALGVIGALRSEGLSVPRDVSVAGFDGIAIGRLMERPLTTIEMPDASMGAAAASLLIDMVDNGAPARHLELGHILRRGCTVRGI
ncbi:MAG: substrate-binding domain-containing protein [Neorhizobium sp.]|jgi:DNA-binding LacI/PurR family transcriptional regulator|nr:substrate-binding domain-containing protein [Neorhizobium sp.]